jgi:hypothetical protein
MADLRRYMDTRELIRKDKAAHRLDLHRIGELPAQITAEILQDICTRLELNDVTLVVPTLNKLIRIVGAVPSLQKFVRDVCALVYSMNDAVGTVVAADPAVSGLDFKQPHKLLATVLPTLKEWEVRLRRTITLEQFQSRVFNELTCDRITSPHHCTPHHCTALITQRTDCCTPCLCVVCTRARARAQ